MSEARLIMVLVHPGSACGSADFTIGDEAPVVRDALAAEISAWPHDMLIIDGDLTDELETYAVLGLAVAAAVDRGGRKLVRQTACDITRADWPQVVKERFDREWPGGPHRVVVTGAWKGGGHEQGCIDAVVERLDAHHVDVSDRALRS